MEKLFVALQHLVPHHTLSRLTGWLAESEIPWLKQPFINLFIRVFRVDMQEAQNPDPTSYPSFNAFFTRALREGARPVDPGEDAVVCPADGSVSQIGIIEDGRIFQAKGRGYTAAELLGDAERARPYADGLFATIYLSPRDYHRVHMPLDGTLVAETYIPGRLFSVNQVTAAGVDRLFARNERLVCYFDTPAGPMAMVLVGAMIVAGIETTWAGQVAPPPRTPRTLDYRDLPSPVSLARGEEMGRFKLGSTVILLFPGDSLTWEASYRAETPTRMGERLATLASPNSVSVNRP